jgi:hypothetical protein
VRIEIKTEGLDGKYGAARISYRTGASVNGKIAFRTKDNVSDTRSFSHIVHPPFSINVQTFVPAGSDKNIPAFGGAWTGITPYEEAYIKAFPPLWTQMLEELFGKQTPPWYHSAY